MRAVPSSFLFPFFLSSFFFLLFLFLFSALPTTNQLVDRFFSSNNAQGRWSHEDDYLIVVSPGCKRSSFTFNHFTIPAYLATAHHRVSPSIFVVTSRTTFSKGVRTSTPTFTALHSVFPTISSPLIYSFRCTRAIFGDSLPVLFLKSRNRNWWSESDRDRERMEKEQGIFHLVESSAYARAFLKVDRVRRSSALRLNLLVAITRIVTGSDLFVALTRSLVAFPFSLSCRNFTLSISPSFSKVINKQCQSRPLILFFIPCFIRI